ncbi:sensor histidine kinase [Amphibiibacter pelophylacis]|uniref:Histidine kinase n=1 Tax=Amphibiibacter pelophylacis TaxID=1799477 RepID=A0ACC6P334_9BURK
MPSSPSPAAALYRPALAQATGLLRALALTLGSSVLALLAMADGRPTLDVLAASGFALWRILVGTLLVWLGLAASQRLWPAWPPRVRWGGLLLLCALVALGVDTAGGLIQIPPQPLLAVALAWAWATPLALWQDAALRVQPPLEAQRRLDELQARIRPHFLFNTLNSALALVTLDPPRAERVLEDLSDLIRATLDQPASAVTLADELRLGHQYLDIETLRFGDGRLRVQWTVDESVTHARLPALTLQPLLENAVRHGVDPDPAGGEIRVQVRRHLGAAEVLIRNSRPDPALPAPPPGRGMALDNVRQRLRLMHDLAAALDVRQAADHFEVRLVLPLDA